MICGICLKTPCVPRCPNANPPKVMGECAQCKEELLEGYEYYIDNCGNKYCSLECACDYNGIKSKEWSEFYYKKNKICFAIFIIISVCLLCWVGHTFAIQNKIDNLESQIEINKEVVEKIQETKIQLHNAAEALRQPYINDVSLASQLSKKWYELDTAEQETLSQIEIMMEKLENLQNKFLGTFELTAYTYGSITATGTTPTANRTIAVDPKVIPLGSKVCIEGYGTYIAEDTGGAVKGNIIDIYIPGYDNCINFGRRKARAWIVE